MDIYWDISDPDAPSPSEVLEFDGYPAIGPAVPPLHLGPPARPGTVDRVGQPRVPALRSPHLADRGVRGHHRLHHHRSGRSAWSPASRADGSTGSCRSSSTCSCRSRSCSGCWRWRRSSPSASRTDDDALGRAQFISLIVILVIFGWMGLARLIRGQVLSLREREFIQAAEVIGVPTRRILFKELLPNLVAPIVVAVSLALPAFVAARGDAVVPRPRAHRHPVARQDGRRRDALLRRLPASTSGCRSPRSRS